MTIEIKTLKQNLEGDVSREDSELTASLNEGWEILSIAILDRNEDYSMLRVVTLKRESRDIEPRPLSGAYIQAMMDLPSLPQDVVKAWRFAMLKRKQNSEFVFEADDELVAELGKILPAPTFTVEELES